MSEATPEQIAMARRICAKCAGDAGTINHPIAPRFLAGELDDHPAMISALAAIIETTRLASAMSADTLDKARAGEIDNDLRAIKHIIIGRFVDDDHLKGHPHE